MIIDDNGYVDPHHFTAQVHILEAHGIWSSLSARPTFSSASCIPRVPTRPPAAGLLKISTLRWLNFWAFFFVFFLEIWGSCGNQSFFFCGKIIQNHWENSLQSQHIAAVLPDRFVCKDSSPRACSPSSFFLKSCRNWDWKKWRHDFPQ